VPGTVPSTDSSERARNNPLIKGLALREMLAHVERAMGVTNLATQAGLGKSNARQYTTTIKSWELDSVVTAKNGWKAMAMGLRSRVDACPQAGTKTGGLNTFTGGGVPVNFSICTRQVCAEQP